MKLKTEKIFLLSTLFLAASLCPLKAAYSYTACLGVPLQVITCGHTYHSFNNGGARGDVVAILFDEGMCQYGNNPEPGKVWAIINDISDMPSTKKKIWYNKAITTKLTNKPIQLSGWDSSGITNNGYPIIRIYMMKLPEE